MAGAERLFAMLDTSPEWSDPPDAIAAPPLQGNVEFEQVTFGYDPARPVLRDISFRVSAGKTVALVGHTGSGKSSIINLLTKFYLPQQGRILLDGQDLLGLTGSSVHQQMGLVLQQNFLFRGTVAENIRFGKPDATEGEIVDVCRRLDCLDMLAALPLGFETQVGERGAQLSLGQRQMICFARALIADPRILILDEATSSIDSRTEQRLQRALKILLAGRTSFVVAHRLSTIREADLVLVLDHGAIVERGTHASLVRAGGIYAHLHQRFAEASGAENTNSVRSKQAVRRTS